MKPVLKAFKNLLQYIKLALKISHHLYGFLEQLKSNTKLKPLKTISLKLSPELLNALQ
jgi:hypothetical protein